MTPTLLFVYGTLRRGHSNHEWLEGAPFVGSCTTAPAYEVTHFENFPALVVGATSVPGELYAVDETLLARLDDFEGSNYRRALVELADGRVVDTYFLADRLARSLPR